MTRQSSSVIMTAYPFKAHRDQAVFAVGQDTGLKFDNVMGAVIFGFNHTDNVLFQVGSVTEAFDTRPVLRPDGHEGTSVTTETTMGGQMSVSAPFDFVGDRDLSASQIRIGPSGPIQ